MIDINLLHDAAYREHFSEGQSIPQDSDARKMYIVVCGSVGVFNAENDKNEDTLTAGVSFGEQLLFTGTSQQKFRALDAVTVYAIAAGISFAGTVACFPAAGRSIPAGSGVSFSP